MNRAKMVERVPRRTVVCVPQAIAASTVSSVKIYSVKMVASAEKINKVSIVVVSIQCTVVIMTDIRLFAI